MFEPPFAMNVSNRVLAPLIIQDFGVPRPISRRGVLFSRLSIGAVILATFFEVVWDPLDWLCAIRFWLSLFFGAAIRGTEKSNYR